MRRFQVLKVRTAVGGGASGIEHIRTDLQPYLHPWDRLTPWIRSEYVHAGSQPRAGQEAGLHQ
jgi:hypothetical protein